MHAKSASQDSKHSHLELATMRSLIALLSLLVIGMLAIGDNPLASLSGAALGKPDGDQESASASGRPNIVVVLADDQRWDAMGNMGTPYARTPHIDRLANEGARFENSFVTTSLCSPSRASLLTGLYAHRHGVPGNLEVRLDPSLDTYPGLLRRSGYRTAYIGKWHIGTTQPSAEDYDYRVSFHGQGVYENPDLLINDKPASPHGYLTDLLTDYAEEWIEQAIGHTSQKPFCLVLSHKSVHAPFQPAERHLGSLDEEAFAPPTSMADDMSDKPEICRRSVLFPATTKDWWAARDIPTPERVPAELPGRNWADIKPYKQRYFESLRSMDDSVGRVLAVLERGGALENTAVILTSDNGYLFGEHRRIDKRFAHEESIRVPLLIRYPSRVLPGARLEQLVLGIDLAPTLLELAGVPIPDVMQGSSLLGLLDPAKAVESTATWRSYFFYECFQERWLHGVPTTLALRTERWKYIVYPEATSPNEELYDLSVDPFELRNLAVVRERAEDLKRMQDLFAQSALENGYVRPSWPGGTELRGLEQD